MFGAVWRSRPFGATPLAPFGVFHGLVRNRLQGVMGKQAGRMFRLNPLRTRNPGLREGPLKATRSQNGPNGAHGEATRIKMLQPTVGSSHQGFPCNQHGFSLGSTMGSFQPGLFLCSSSTHLEISNQTYINIDTICSNQNERDTCSNQNGFQPWPSSTGSFLWACAVRSLASLESEACPWLVRTARRLAAAVDARCAQASPAVGRGGRFGRGV